MAVNETECLGEKAELFDNSVSFIFWGPSKWD
jgi:hypothetical protein